MFNPFSLEGKTILVTGASSGIGRGIAVDCSKMGAKIVLTGRDEKRLTETLQMLEGEGHFIVIADISKQEDIESLAMQCPAVNGCVFSAGIAKLMPVKFIDRASLEEIINVNEMAPILLLAQLYRKKKLQNKASVIYIASLSGVYKSKIGESIYAASKGGIAGFVKEAALELSVKGIRVNTICPAFIQTEMTKMYDGAITKVEKQEDLYPLKRLGVTQDVSYAAVYLLSDASSWVTGVNLPVDGGYCLT